MKTLVAVARNLKIQFGMLVFLAACSQVEPSGGLQKAEIEEETAEEVPIETTASKQATYDAFKITAYPILEANCGSCHGSTAAPKFAEEDSAASHDALVAAGKVDFDDITQSRVVLRLIEDRHNCWGDCEENGAELAKAIENWGLSRLADGGSKKKLTGVATAEIALSEIKKLIVANPADIGMIAFEAESGLVAGNLIIATDADASDASLVTSEVDAGVIAGDLATAHTTNTELGTITYNIIASEDGFYKMYAFARRATGNPVNDFFVKIDDGDMVTWNIGSDTNANEFRTNEEAGVEQYLDWDKGPHTVTIYQAMLGASIDKLIITKNNVPDFAEVVVNPLNFDSLTFDLTTLLDVEASFSINLIKEGDGIYRAQNPTLFNPTNANIKLRGISPLISGEFSDVNAIYKDVDVLTNKDFEVLSTGSSIYLLGTGEEGEDPLLSISFDLLEISAIAPVEEEVQ